MVKRELINTRLSPELIKKVNDIEGKNTASKLRKVIKGYFYGGNQSKASENNNEIKSGAKLLIDFLNEIKTTYFFEDEKFKMFIGILLRYFTLEEFSDLEAKVKS